MDIQLDTEIAVMAQAGRARLSDPQWRRIFSPFPPNLTTLNGGTPFKIATEKIMAAMPSLDKALPINMIHTVWPAARAGTHMEDSELLLSHGMEDDPRESRNDISQIVDILVAGMTKDHKRILEQLDDNTPSKFPLIKSQLWLNEEDDADGNMIPNYVELSDALEFTLPLRPEYVAPDEKGNRDPHEVEKHGQLEVELQWYKVTKTFQDGSKEDYPVFCISFLVCREPKTHVPLQPRTGQDDYDKEESNSFYKGPQGMHAILKEWAIKEIRPTLTWEDFVTTIATGQDCEEALDQAFGDTALLTHIFNLDIARLMEEETKHQAILHPSKETSNPQANKPEVEEEQVNGHQSNEAGKDQHIVEIFVQEGLLKRRRSARLHAKGNKAARKT